MRYREGQNRLSRSMRTADDSADHPPTLPERCLAHIEPEFADSIEVEGLGLTVLNPPVFEPLWSHQGRIRSAVDRPSRLILLRLLESIVCFAKIGPWTAWQFALDHVFNASRDYSTH